MKTMFYHLFIQVLLLVIAVKLELFVYWCTKQKQLMRFLFTLQYLKFRMINFVHETTKRRRIQPQQQLISSYWFSDNLKSKN